MERRTEVRLTNTIENKRRWFHASGGYRSMVGAWLSDLWFHLRCFKQEICWRLLGRTHIRNR